MPSNPQKSFSQDAPASKPCCTPSVPAAAAAASPRGGMPEIAPGPRAGSREGMAHIEDGTFLMGADDDEIWRADGEDPVREIRLEPFYIDRSCVTNREFEDFVEDSGYITEAERFGWSFVFHNQIPKAHRKKLQYETVQGISWWAKVEKADWRRPGGPGTNIRKRMDHPVVHVSWHDAAAFSLWAGKRLPREAEWECAARGGLRGKRYPWGDELTPGGKHRCNIWQGRFPQEDTADDGYDSTAPARSFKPNGFGLYNVSGNVWEWSADWFSPDYHKRNGNGEANPAGPPQGVAKVIRGGSFLCHASYCNRYRVSARSSNTPDSATCHTGFRCAMDAP